MFSDRTYSWLKRFEVKSALFLKSNKVPDLVNTVVDSTNDDEIRQILSLGIDEFIKQRESSKIVSNIHAKFKKQSTILFTQPKNDSAMTETNPSSTQNDSTSSEVFGIQSLVSHVMQFCSLKDIMYGMRLVNKIFMYTSYEIISFWYLNTSSLYKVEYVDEGYNPDDTDHITYYCHTLHHNLNEFANVESITLSHWPDDMSELMEQISSFNKIKEIHLTCDNKRWTDEFSEWCTDYGEIIKTLIENNKNSIERITMSFDEDEPVRYEPKRDTLKTHRRICKEHIFNGQVLLPRLKSLTFNKVSFTETPLVFIKKTIIWSNIERLDIIKCKLSSKMKMIKLAKKLKNIKHLTIKHNQIPHTYDNDARAVRSSRERSSTDQSVKQPFMANFILQLPQPSKLQSLCLDINSKNEYINPIKTHNGFPELKDVELIIRHSSVSATKTQLRNIFDALYGIDTKTTIGIDESDGSEDNYKQQSNLKNFIIKSETFMHLFVMDLLGSYKKVASQKLEHFTYDGDHWSNSCQFEDLEELKKILNVIISFNFPNTDLRLIELRAKFPCKESKTEKDKQEQELKEILRLVKSIKNKENVHYSLQIVDNYRDNGRISKLIKKINGISYNRKLC